MGDDGKVIGVAPNEQALGWPTVKFEISF
jgi:hypothetical protein